MENAGSLKRNRHYYIDYISKSINYGTTQPIKGYGPSR